MLGKSTLPALVAIALGAAPSPARPAPPPPVRLSLPASPRLVAVGPGVQVVEGVNEDVFVASGWWWLRRRGAWYRSPGPQLSFSRVETARVPLTVVAIPPGRYRNLGEAEARAAAGLDRFGPPRRGDPLAGSSGLDR